MASFYYQLFSNESLLQQWERYMHTKPLIKNIEDVVQDQTDEFQKIIEKSTEEQVQAVQESTEVVCGTLTSGFDLVSANLTELSYGLGQVRSEINDLASMLDWRLSCFIEQQRISNLLLGNIAMLLRIPDIQKERQYHIEQGIKFLKNSFLGNDFFEDALRNLIKAEEIEPSDFFALHRIGMIYLYSPKHIDLKKAEAYFRKAAKYAFAETIGGASLSTNILASDPKQDYNSQIPTVDSIKIQSAESYLFAGRSCYLQRKYDEAAELAGKAYEIAPEMVEAGFTQAKALSANNKTSDAVLVLKSVIEKDRFYSIKTITDLDLSPKPEVRNLLKDLRNEVFSNASAMLLECKDFLIDESIVQNEINLIEKLIDKSTYLHCRKAIDLIRKNRQRTFSDIFKTNKSSNVKENRNLKELPDLLADIKKKVKYPESYIQKINDLFLYLENCTQWKFPQFKSYSNVLNFQNGYEPKNLTSSLTEFIKQEKDYFIHLLVAKAQIKIIIDEIYHDDIKRRKEDDRQSAKIEKERQAADQENKAESVGVGVQWGLAGGGVGLVVGFILGLIVQFVSCVANNSEKGSGKYNTVIVISSAVICGIIGFSLGYSDKRKKKQ